MRSKGVSSAKLVVFGVNMRLAGSYGAHGQRARRREERRLTHVSCARLKPKASEASQASFKEHVRASCGTTCEVLWTVFERLPIRSKVDSYAENAPTKGEGIEFLDEHSSSTWLRCLQNVGKYQESCAR